MMSTKETASNPLDSIKSIIHTYSKSVETAKSNVSNVLLESNKQIEEAYEIFVNNMNHLQDTLSECLKEDVKELSKPVVLSVIDSTSNDIDVIIGFTKSPVLYSIEMKYLKRYPSNIIYTSYMEHKNMNDKGNIILDYDDTLFPMILSYLRNEPLCYEELDNNYLYQLYKDVIYYRLPMPIRLRCFEKRKEIESRWNQSIIHIEVEGVVYAIERSRLSELNITTSFFNLMPPSTLDYYSDKDILICYEPYHYFKYIASYIETGYLMIEDQNDLQHIDRIQNEFKDLNIEVRESEWKRYLPYSSYFPESHILNDDYIDVITSWIGKDKKWRLLYRGSRDGFLASSFHEKCDKKGETFTFIRNYDNDIKNIFGGYTSKSWLSNHTYNYDEDAFLFTLKNPFNIPPTKLDCIAPAKATFNHTGFGPLFGYGNDIAVSNECNKEKGGWINCPGTKGYENNTGKGNSLFVNTAGSNEGNYFRVDEIEVYGL